MIPVPPSSSRSSPNTPSQREEDALTVITPSFRVNVALSKAAGRQAGGDRDQRNDRKSIDINTQQHTNMQRGSRLKRRLRFTKHPAVQKGQEELNESEDRDRRTEEKPDVQTVSSEIGHVKLSKKTISGSISSRLM